ncbi:NADP-dependent oxidoreductase [Streptomyces sp. NPDC048415]|uniref:NADP-dependent oxidoreductase n=1 Tax=Streptomyces sp. NPDC048415 TaxID=3154822 RepID=UPI00341A4321
MAFEFANGRAKIMRAVVYRSVGAPDVIEVADVELPEPGMFEIRIKVDAAALNPADVAAWSGLFPAPAQGSHFGLGWDVAGTVDAVGPGAAWEVGTPVIAIVQSTRATGVVRAQAEYTIVPSNALAHAPAGIDAVHASTIPLNGLTAAQSVELLGLSDGQSVFITGAAGAVGGYAVQLAKRRGLTVIASDFADDENFVTSVLGADAFVPASENPAAAVRRLYPHGVDAVLDTTLLGVIAAVRDGGTFVTTRMDALPQAERGIRVRLTQVSPDAAMLTTLSDLATSGALALRVAQTYLLEEAAQAHGRLAEGGLRGRLVLTP